MPDGCLPASRSFTRLITSCGSNGFTSTPSHPTERARDFVDRLERAGQQHHRNVGKGRRPLDEGRHLVAVAFGHADVGQDDVGTIALDALDRVSAVADGDDLDVLVGERQLDDTLNRDGIIGEQQLVRHAIMIP